MQAEREAREGTLRPLPADTLWVRFVFVDHAGIQKTKAVHRDGFERRARAGVGLAKGVLALDPSGMLHPESGLSPVGECRLVPDLSTLAPLPFARGAAAGARAAGGEGVRVGRLVRGGVLRVGAGRTAGQDPVRGELRADGGGGAGRGAGGDA